MGRFLLTLFVSIAALFCFSTSRAFAEEVKIGAGAAPTENVFAKVMEPMEKAIGLKVVLISNGPAAALKELDEGKVDAASGGLTFADWMNMMEKEGYAIPDKTAYKHRVIGKDVVKVFIHKDIPIGSLSGEQIEAVFTGKVTSWKDVGGPDVPIVVVWGNKIPGTNSVFQKQAMNDQPFLSNRIEVGTAQEVKTKVSATVGAVGIGPISLADSSLTVPSIPEVGRPITLITKGAPSPAIVKMLDYIAGEGQKYIAQ